MVLPRRVVAISRNGTLLSLGSCALVGLTLWGARDLLIPLTLAFLLSFISGSFLDFLERHGVRQSIAVGVLATGLVGLVVLGVWILAAQFAYLSRSLPIYSKNLHQKMDYVESSVRQAIEQYRWPLPSKKTPLKTSTPSQPVPEPVAPLSLSDGVQDYAPSLLHYLAVVVFVLVLSLFMSVYRDDLRDRFIRLAGERNVHFTSEMLEEAASKVSAYLWTQLAVNSVFGVVTGAGFFLLGLQYAFLWGTVLGLLRFIPYVGVVIGGFENCIGIVRAKNCLVQTSYGDGAELVYHSTGVGDNAYNIRFSWECWMNVRDLEYCMYTSSGCANCFGCIGLKHKSYCILNRQYSKAEYEELLARIRAQMRASGEYGQFFPSALSPHAYNQSWADHFMPLTQQEVLSSGLRWNEDRERAGEASILPDHIDLTDDTVLGQIFACSLTGKPYRINRAELDFYRKMRLALPRMAPLERIKQRAKFLSIPAIGSAACANCQAPIQTAQSATNILCQGCFEELRSA